MAPALALAMAMAPTLVAPLEVWVARVVETAALGAALVEMVAPAVLVDRAAAQAARGARADPAAALGAPEGEAVTAEIGRAHV